MIYPESWFLIKYEVNKLLPPIYEVCSIGED